MKTKRTVAVVTTLALLFTGAVCAGICAWQVLTFQNAKESTADHFAVFAQDCFRDMNDPQQAMGRFMACTGGNLGSDFPYAAVLLNENGELLARSGDTLVAAGAGAQSDNMVVRFDYYSFSTAKSFILPINVLFMELTPYLSPEDRAQLAGLPKNERGYCAVSSFTLCKTSEETVPVSLTLKPAGGNNEVTLSLSDREPNVKRTDGITGSSVYVFSACKDPKLTGVVAEMEENLAEIQAAAKGIKDPRTMQLMLESSARFPSVILPLFAGERTLWFVLTYTYRPFTAALSWSVRYFYMALPVCVLLYICALLLALRWRKKQMRLETSRYSFLSAAAHELKTPISVILSSGECIRDGIAPEKTKVYSEKIIAQGERMQSLVSQMLQQNRLLSADSVKKTPFDLSVLLAEEAKKYLTAADQKEIILVTDIEPHISILADQELIALAIDNYLSNAVKYSPEKAGITISLHRTGRKATVTVANTGSRIAKEDLPHIFEELYRADQVRTGGSGSGLGLSIARRIFELHGYRYGAASDETSTRFFFSAKETHRM